MPDIRVFIHNQRATFVAESDVGKKWMRQEMVLTGECFTSVDREHLEDIVRLMQDAELIVEY